MPIISVRIPQLGEGLQEALLVELLKQPGDKITRDEPIYTMETDKATTDVESPYSGTLVEWTAESGTVLAIGTEIAKMDVADGVKEMPASHIPGAILGGSPAATAASESAGPATTNQPSSASSGAKSPSNSRPIIPPKTRKYLKEHNLLDEAEKIPTAGQKLMPSDVDAYLASLGGGAVSSDLYQVKPLPKSQVILNYRLSRGVKSCVPVTVMTEIDWTKIETARNASRETGGPSGFAMACWAVVVAMKQHEKFRSALTADGAGLKVFHHVNLGIAVALPGDEMVTAVVEQADTMSTDEFYAAYQQQVVAARDGNDQANESTTFTISNIGKAGMRIGIPAIVAPAVATLAIGEVYQHPVPDGDSFKFQPMVTATLSFDHRIANGVGAANFMNDFKSNVQTFEL